MSKEDAEPIREVGAEVLAGHQATFDPKMRRRRIVTNDQIIAFQETDCLRGLDEYGNEPGFRSFSGDQWRRHGGLTS